MNLITWLARKFLRENAHLSPESQDRVLKVLAKAHRLKVARIEAAAVIERASQQAPYPMPEESINPPPGPWSTGPERSDYAVQQGPDRR
jgi:hypothetical protein